MDQARHDQNAAKEYADSVWGFSENAGIDPRANPAAGVETELMLQARAAAAAPDFDWAGMASSRSEHDISNRPIATVLGFSDLLNRDSRRAVASEEARTLRAY